MEVHHFVPEFGLEIFFLYHEDNHLRINFWVINTLVGSHSRDLIAWKMCWIVTFSHLFSHKFWTVRNSKRRSECFRKYTFWDGIRTKILYFFDGNRESYCCLYSAWHVTWNMDSNYDPIDGRKNGSLMFFSQMWLRNFFSISREHSSQNQILGKKYVSG